MQAKKTTQKIGFFLFGYFLTVYGLWYMEWMFWKYEMVSKFLWEGKKFHFKLQIMLDECSNELVHGTNDVPHVNYILRNCVNEN